MPRVVCPGARNKNGEKRIERNLNYYAANLETIIAAVSSTAMIDSIIRRRLRMPGIAPASFGKQLAEQTAGREPLCVGSLIADDALAAELYSGSGAVVLPAAHPVALTPAV